VALSQELHDMGGGQWIAGLPTDSSQNHIGRPTIARERGLRVGREITLAGAAGIPLATVFIIAVALGGGVLAAGAMNHGTECTMDTNELRKLSNSIPSLYI